MVKKSVKVNEGSAYLETATAIIFMFYLATDRLRKSDIGAALLKVILVQNFTDLTSQFQHVWLLD